MNNIGKIIGVYKGHPLNKKSILSRVIKYRGTLINVSELDLAVDNNAEITDQNHIGGIEFVWAGWFCTYSRSFLWLQRARGRCFRKSNTRCKISNSVGEFRPTSDF